MDSKAKADAVNEGREGIERKKFDDAFHNHKELTIPYIKGATGLQIPVASRLTVVLPRFESGAYDKAILMLVDESNTGPARVGQITSGSDTEVVIEQQNFKPGDRVKAAAYLHLKTEDIYVRGLESQYYTFR